VSSVDRRNVLKAAVCLNVWLTETAAYGQPDPATTRPQPGDRLVFAAGERKHEIVTLAEVPVAAPPLITYPLDPATKIVRDGSRLNQVLLVRFDPGELAEETRRRAAAGIVAYSAVCTHTGCDVWDWDADAKRIKCPCHFSVFDVTDAARVVDGPAPRRLPALPVNVADGELVVASEFVGRPGFQQGGL
jgi:Rieske Fe-S protein